MMASDPCRRFAVVFSFFILLATCVSAQGAGDAALLTSFPTCATQCFLQIVPTTGCNATDFDCLCAHPTFGDESVACFSNSCTAKDTLRATNVSTVLCDWPIRDEGTKVEVSIIVLTSLAALFVLLRLVARNPFKSDLFGWDDGLIVVALLLTAPLLPTQLLLVDNGMGQDIWKVPFNAITQFLKLFYICEVWYMFGVNIMKVSILFFYLRVFPRSRTTTAAKVTLWVVGIYGFAFLMLILFQCWPLSYIWTRWDGEHSGKCVPLSLLWVHAAINIVLDLFILLLPLPKLLKLQMNYSWAKKVRVVIMFSAGIVVTFTSIMRMRTLSLMSYSRPNFTWDWTDCALWSGIEANVGIICACMPAVRAFFVQKLPNWFQSTRGSKTGGSSYAAGAKPSNNSRDAASTPAGSNSAAKKDGFIQLTHYRSTESGSETELTPVDITAVPPTHQKYNAKIWGGERSRKRQSWPAGADT